MKIPQFLVDELEPRTQLSREATHHIRRVLRMRVGELLWLCNGQGTRLPGRLLQLAPQAIVQLVESEASPAVEPNLELIVGVGLCNGAHFESALERACELGIRSLVPVLCRYGRLREPGATRLERWRRLAGEATCLAGRARVPTVTAPQSLDTFLLQAQGQRRVLFEQGKPGLSGIFSGSAAVLLGPEAGWSTEESDRAAALGWERAGLGPRNLRVETAVTAAVAIAMYLSGDLNGEFKC